MRAWTAMATAVLVGAPTAAGAQNVKSGVEAWQRGDYSAAVQQWRGPAVAGDADAQFNMGQAYKLGRGVPVDPAQAQEWFRKAAVQGHDQAETNYGLALFTAGRKADAAPWLEKAVARGEPRGELVLGTMLFNGDGVPRDMPRAYALMTLAAQAGLRSASETLAQMDQYVSPAEREAGVRLARQFAARQGGAAAAVPHGRVRASQLVPPATPLARPAVAPAPAKVAAKPAPKSAAASRPVAAKAASGGGWRAQLGAFRARANAEALWARVRGRMTGAQPSYSEGGGFTRLQATGFATRAEAARACAAAGLSCVISTH